MGPLGVLQTRTRAAHRVGHGLYGFVLPYHTFVQLVPRGGAAFALALQHSAHRNAGPAAYHVGNIVGSYLFLYYGVAALVFLQFLLHAEYLVVKGFYLSVTYFGHLAVIAGAFGLVGLETQLLYLQFVLLYLAEQFLFGLPFGAEVGSLL